jgi:hypothetical protein
VSRAHVPVDHDNSAGPRVHHGPDSAVAARPHRSSLERRSSIRELATVVQGGRVGHSDPHHGWHNAVGCWREANDKKEWWRRV